MKLKVPFIKQSTSLNCGPVALQMVLQFFDDATSIEILENKTEIKEGKGIYTIQIGVAAASLGYKVSFYSKEEDTFEENSKKEFYKKFSALNKTELGEWVKKGEKLGISFHKQSLELDDLLQLVSTNSVPIILLDWNIIKDKEGYQGHFVPVVGHDSEYIYIHNHGLSETKEYMQVKKGLFDKARKSSGTDEDIVIIHRK
jgi:hypothetical protein